MNGVHSMLAMAIAVFLVFMFAIAIRELVSQPANDAMRNAWKRRQERKTQEKEAAKLETPAPEKLDVTVPGEMGPNEA